MLNFEDVSSDALSAENMEEEIPPDMDFDEDFGDVSSDALSAENMEEEISPDMTEDESTVDLSSDNTEGLEGEIPLDENINEGSIDSVEGDIDTSSIENTESITESIDLSMSTPEANSGGAIC